MKTGFYFIFLITLLLMLASCNESRVEESSTQIDYPYHAEVQVLINPSQLHNSEAYESHFYTEKGFSELLLSKVIFDKTCSAIGVKGQEIQNEIIIKPLSNTDIFSITVNGMDTLSSQIFLKQLIDVSVDSIMQSVLQPMNDSLLKIEDAIDNELRMIHEADLYENDYQRSEKIYTKLVEQRTELMIKKAGVVQRVKVLSWGFKGE